VSRGNEFNYTIFINIPLNVMRFKPPRDERRVLAQPQKVTVWAAIPHCANAVYRRHPFTAPDERFRFSIVGLGLALKRTVFAQCVITPYSSGNRTTEEPTNTIGGFLFFIRHYESSIPTGASGASQTTQCQSVAMLDQGQKNGDAKGNRESLAPHPRKSVHHHIPASSL
jgi:hypothetical protein